MTSTTEVAPASGEKAMPFKLLIDTPLPSTAAPARVASPRVTRLAERIVSALDATAAHMPAAPILVSGSWGAGKTTLLREVQRRLDTSSPGSHIASPYGGKAGKRDTRTVWFEAWRYEGETPLMPALLRTLWEASPTKGLPEEWNKLIGRALVGTLGLAAHVAAFASGAGSVGAILKDFVPWTLNVLGRAEKSAPVEPPQHDIDQLRSDLIERVRKGWGLPEDSQGAVVVFVDDLDRCTPAGTVALLDALRALVVGVAAASGATVESLPLRFVVALDRESVVDAVTRKFSTGISTYDGNRYLEKIFPFAFHISTPDAAEAGAMRDTLLREADIDGHAREGLDLALRAADFSNPRLMIRCINRFLLATRHAGTPPKPPDGPRVYHESLILAEWIAATERWPALRRLRQHREDGFFRALRPREGALPMSDDPEVQALLKQPGAAAWLASALADHDGLRAFAEQDDHLRGLGL